MGHGQHRSFLPHFIRQLCLKVAADALPPCGPVPVSRALMGLYWTDNDNCCATTGTRAWAGSRLSVSSSHRRKSSCTASLQRSKASQAVFPPVFAKLPHRLREPLSRALSGRFSRYFSRIYPGFNHRVVSRPGGLCTGAAAVRGKPAARLPLLPPKALMVKIRIGFMRRPGSAICLPCCPQFLPPFAPAFPPGAGGRRSVPGYWKNHRWLFAVTGRNRLCGPVLSGQIWRTHRM